MYVNWDESEVIFAPLYFSHYTKHNMALNDLGKGGVLLLDRSQIMQNFALALLHAGGFIKKNRALQGRQ